MRWSFGKLLAAMVLAWPLGGQPVFAASQAETVERDWYLVAQPIQELGETNWSISGRVDVEMLYDDNVFLRNSNVESAWGGTVSPALDLVGRTERLELDLTSRFEFNRFNETSLNSEDVFFETGARYLTELGQWGLNANVDYDTTRTSEVTDTGILEDPERSIFFDVAPFWSYTLSQRDSLRLGGDYSEQRYETNDPDLTEFRYYLLDGTYEHKLSERILLELGLFGSRFETLNNEDVDSDAAGAQLGVTYAASERLTLRLSAGPRFTSTKQSNDNSFGFIGAASVDYLLDEQTTLGFSASQALEPSGGGELVERRRVEISADHQLLPLVSIGLAGRYIGNRHVGDGLAERRDYFAAEPFASWRVAEDWDLSVRYRFQTQESEDENGGWANSNAVFLSLTYNTPTWVLAP